MTSLKKLFRSSYNLGKASQPEPLPENEVKMDHILAVIHRKQKATSNTTISSRELRQAFIDQAQNESRLASSEG